MATHNAPKHDFAPAWLKIPSQENPKPTGSKQIDQSSDKASRPRKEDNSYRYGSDYSKLHRQNSFENYHDNNKRHPSGQTKHRHHSVDDDFYAYPYGYYNGYGYNYEKYGMQYGSQPSLFRPPNRDGKYQHTNARFGQLNGAYPNYYDLYPYDNVHGDAYFNWYSGKGNSKKNYYEKEGRSNSKEGKEKDFEKNKEKENGKEKSLKDDDFPSLNGANDDNDSKPTKPSNSSGGVWDHPPMGKSSYNRLDDRDEKYTSHMYKALLPNKPLIARRTNKDGLRFNGGFNGSGKPSYPASNTSSFSKEALQQSPTPPIDILNTRFVTQPKNLADKKSDFLRALRKENNSKQNDNHTEKKNNESNNNESKVDKHRQNCDDIYNGIDTLNVNDKSSNILSSSMEAEQRLLKEMGWKEEDDDDESYEITEDEMKEFQNLSQKVKQERNGLVRALPKAWSPKHIPLYQPNAQELNDSLSSSDSDDSC